MENGGVGHDREGELTGKFSSLALGNEINGSPNANDGLFQVMKAVEAAEATIKQQVEENNRLRFELQRKTQELEKHKSDNLSSQIPHFVDNSDDSIHEPQKAHQSVSPLANQAVGLRGVDNSSTPDPSGTVALQKVLVGSIGDPLQTFQDKYKNSKIDGPLRMLPGGQAVSDNTHIFQLSSPSSASVSPGRYQMEGEYDSRFSLSGQRLLPMAETKNSISLLNQVDLVAKIREHEEEILRLRKHLAEYSIKEAKIRNEKYVLEKRIAYMRMAFDQQQQDLVDAASKAISYRQDIIEKNIHLTYALQDAQQERSIFVSSLMPLLAEYSFQPPVADAESIVSNVKVLFKHLQEKLILTEAKLNESEYQLAPVRSDANPLNLIASQSHSGNKNGLVLVPQPTYSSGQIALSSDPLPTRGWDLLGSHQTVSDMPDTLGRYSPIASRNTRSLDVPTQFDVSQGNSHPGSNNEETTTKDFTLSDRVSSREMDDPDMDGHHNEREAEINWGSKNNSYTLQDDPSSSYSPYLPPVLEEPTSSFSEAADDDPIPAIEGLQISGAAFPGFELQASGYSINGTTSCNFEWVRHLEDGSVNYIDGAKQPNYLVTADDVGTYLAIEVQPLDDRKRKGELVKVFANDHKKINCDPEMQSYIEKTLYSGHASCRVSLSVGYLDIWEPASLAIKREGYSIKCSGPSGIITEKFTPATVVMIPYGNPTEFSIIGSGGTERLLRIDNSATDIVGSRDTIVLALRLFIIRAGEKRKGKKRGLFFK